MDTALTTMLSIIVTVMSGIILFLMTRFLSQQQSKEEEKEAKKSEESRLILQFLNALGKLSIANCLALRDGKSSVNMSAALNEFEKADKALYDYIVASHVNFTSKK